MRKRSRAHDAGSIEAGSIEADRRKAKRFWASITSQGGQERAEQPNRASLGAIAPKSRQPGCPGARRAAKSSQPGPNRTSQGAQERTEQPKRDTQSTQERTG